ncbi:hypothetical protein [Neolewinella persica]|uniref:hypothetical protein n=1 Tax=Neolewinella persica TaxID=70998 RepID=UPI00036DD27C|nr:hypothetical protein [Neolewinella persica]
METSKLSRELIEAYNQQDVKKVDALIVQGLKAVSGTNEDWNRGNLLHQIHTIKGLLFLENNEIEEAKEQLIKAIKVPKSPQLNGFGPNMLLAKKLLEKGEAKVVLEYLDLSKHVWSLFTRFIPLLKWRNDINKNRTPDFKANLRYHLV